MLLFVSKHSLTQGEFNFRVKTGKRPTYDHRNIIYLTYISTEVLACAQTHLKHYDTCCSKPVCWNTFVATVEKRMHKKYLKNVGRCWNNSWFSNRTGTSVDDGTNTTSCAQFAALPLVKPVIWFARPVVNWRSRSVAKSGVRGLILYYFLLQGKKRQFHQFISNNMEFPN